MSLAPPSIVGKGHRLARTCSFFEARDAEACRADAPALVSSPAWSTLNWILQLVPGYLGNKSIAAFQFAPGSPSEPRASSHGAILLCFLLHLISSHLISSKNVLIASVSIRSQAVSGSTGNPSTDIARFNSMSLILLKPDPARMVCAPFLGHSFRLLEFSPTADWLSKPPVDLAYQPGLRPQGLSLALVGLGDSLRNGEIMKM